MKRKINELFSCFIWLARETKGHIKSLLILLSIQVISALTGAGMAIVSKNLVDHAIEGKIDYVVYYGIAFGCIIILSLGSNAISSLINARTNELFSNSLRQRMFARISGSEWSDITKYHSGDLLTRLTSDINTISNGVVNVLPSIISLGVSLIASFATLLYYEPYLAIFAVIFSPFSIIVSRLWGRKIKIFHKKIQEAESTYRSYIQESLENITVVKAFRMEEKAVETVETLHNDRMKWVLKRNRTGVAASMILAGGYWLSYLIAFGWGAIGLANKTITYGTLTAFLQLIGQVEAPFIGLSRTLPQVITTISSAERLMELEKMEMERGKDKLDPNTSVELSFKDVSFSYNKDDTVLKNVSLSIKPGEVVAITGPSGEGKTTIIRLCLALLKPDNGSVKFFDSSGNEFPASASTRDWIAYVPQGNTLFSGTIADNLRNGYADATDEEIIAAAKTACAWEFIEKLPDGLDTVIGENGLGLSEGQAQRLALARAILRPAPVLILDEATSALDIDLEMRVLEGIKNLSPKRSCLVITHRLSALQICSRVFKLKDGIIMEIPMPNALESSDIDRQEIKRVIGK